MYKMNISSVISKNRVKFDQYLTTKILILDQIYSQGMALRGLLYNLKETLFQIIICQNYLELQKSTTFNDENIENK